MQHLLKGRKNLILVKFMIYAVLLQILISLNLCSFSLPMTWSSSILHSPTLPVKPILTLCHPLDERLEAYLISVKEGCIKVHKFKKKMPCGHV